MKLYFIPKHTEIGVYKLDEILVYDGVTPNWIPSDCDCLFTETKILYRGTSVWRIKIDRLEFYVSIKGIQEWTP